MVCAWDPSPGEMETERVLRSLANWLNLIGKFQTTSERLFQTHRHTHTCARTQGWDREEENREEKKEEKKEEEEDEEEKMM